MTVACVLSEPTLVLNRSWMAVATTTVRNALSMLYAGTAKAVHPESFEMHEFATWSELAVAPDQPCVRSVTLQIAVPEVIVLTGFDKPPNRAVPFTRRNLFRRDHNTCQFCGLKPGTSELSIDHVVPRSRGGVSSWTNCVLACMRCNRRKGNRTPEEAHMHLLHRPSRPRWSPTLDVPIGRVRQSWERFVSDRYWDVPLEP